MGRVRLTLAEKKRKLLELFHESSSFYKRDELEKLADKQKGIVSNTVRGVLDELISDGLVETDRVGSTTLFWSLPNKAHIKRRRQEAQLDAELAQCKRRTFELQERCKHARAKQ